MKDIDILFPEKTVIIKRKWFENLFKMVDSINEIQQGEIEADDPERSIENIHLAIKMYIESAKYFLPEQNEE